MEPDERDAVIAALQAALESFGKSMQVLKKERDEARAQVEIIKPNENNLVAEFFSSSNTPETDKFKIKFKTPCGEKYWVPVEHSQRLERERDEARNAIVGWENKWKCAIEMAAKAEVESDEAREQLSNLQDQLDVAMKSIKRLEDQINELKS